MIHRCLTLYEEQNANNRAVHDEYNFIQYKLEKNEKEANKKFKDIENMIQTWGKPSG